MSPSERFVSPSFCFLSVLFLEQLIKETLHSKELPLNKALSLEGELKELLTALKPTNLPSPPERKVNHLLRIDDVPDTVMALDIIILLIPIGMRF